MRRESKIPTLLGLFFLVISLAAGVVILSQRQLFSLKATPQSSPQDVRTTNITETGFSVSWSTESTGQGAILFGESDSLDLTLAEEGSNKTHHLDLENLKPNTQYFFKILSGTTTYDNKGKPWVQKTAPYLAPKTADIISGTVKTKEGSPAERALIYLTIANGGTLSTITNREGSFSLNLAKARTTKLSAYLPYNEATTLSIFVKSQKGEIGSLQILVGNARPLPEIILGKTQDLRGEVPSGGTGEFTSPKSGIKITTPTPYPKGSPKLESDLTFVASGSAATTASPRPLGGTSPTPSPSPKTPKPSASPKPTSTPPPSPSPSPTLKASPNISPTPLSSLPGTQSGVPISGDLTMTFLLTILGIGSIFTGLILFKKSEKNF